MYCCYCNLAGLPSSWNRNFTKRKRGLLLLSVMLPAPFSNPWFRKSVFIPASASGVWAMCVPGLGGTGGEKVKILPPVWWYFQFCFPDMPATVSFLANWSTHSLQGWYLHSIERQTGLGLPHLAHNWFQSVLSVCLYWGMWVKWKSLSCVQLFLTLWTVQFAVQWVAFPFSRGSSQPRNQTGVSCIAGEFFTNWAMGSPHWGIVDLQYYITVSGIQHSDLVFLCYALFKGITK